MPRGLKWVMPPSLPLVLRERYDSKSTTITALAMEFGVPRRVISKWAQKLGVSRRRASPWSEEDENYLAQNVSHVAFSGLARHLHRSKYAVELHARRMGLRKRDGDYTMWAVAQGLDVSHSSICLWIAKKWLKASRRNSERSRDLWFITERNLRSFIIQHPTEIDRGRPDIVWLVDLLANGHEESEENYT